MHLYISRPDIIMNVYMTGTLKHEQSMNNATYPLKKSLDKVNLLCMPDSK